MRATDVAGGGCHADRFHGPACLVGPGGGFLVTPTIRPLRAATVIWGWVLVSIAIMCVALNMAELASSMPQAGGMMYWTYRLSRKACAPLLSWVAGWINVIAQVSGNAGQAALLAELTTVRPQPRPPK